MANPFSKNRWFPIVSNILLIVVGIVVFTLSVLDCVANKGLGTPTYSGTGIAISIAVALFTIGLLFVIQSFVSEPKVLLSKNTLYAVAAISIGILLFVGRGDLSGYLVVTLGYAFCASGAIVLGKAIGLITHKEKVIVIVFAFILAALLATVGILALIPETTGTIGLLTFFVLALTLVVVGTVGLVKVIKQMSNK